MATFQGAGGIILWLLVLLSCVLKHERADARGLRPQEEDMELERLLKMINKPAIKTFSMENGDTVDCVDIYKQHAFDNPLLKDHKIQLDRNFSGSSIRRAESELEEPYRLASLELVECPEGTVPIRRTSKEELRNHNMNLSTLQMPLQDANPSPYRNYYALRGTDVGRFKGGHAGLTIHEHADVKPHQFISSQFILWGDDPSENGGAIFVGWHINPELYGDTKPRFTVYFQSGGKGCYNMLCPGFVYTSKKYYLGSRIILHYGPGTVNYIKPYLLMSESGPDRWQVVLDDFSVREGYDILGYWPAKLLTSFPENSAARILAGGIVQTPQNEKSPPMGSGDWPTDGRQFSAYVSRICMILEDFRQDCIFDKDELVDFEAVFNTDSSCYGVGKMMLADNVNGHFYYGGPGGCTPS